MLQLLGPVRELTVEHHLAGGLLVMGAYLVLLLAAGHVLSSHRHQRTIAIVLGVIPLGVAVARTVPAWSISDIEVGAAATPFLVFVCATVLSYVLRGREVTTDHLFGAAACFMLLGQVWAGCYAIVLLTDPKPPSFSPEQVGWDDLVYFSTVTLTTLGYGDITPRSQPARALATLEAMAGLFYFAVIVSRLVGKFSLKG